MTFQKGVVPLIFGRTVVVKFQVGEVVILQQMLGVVQLVPGVVLFKEGVVKLLKGGAGVVKFQ